ncbi:MAG TPA: hypothetical protein VGP07_10550 [Polyangia bacterium]|jgi:hypothetical protein
MVVPFDSPGASPEPDRKVSSTHQTVSWRDQAIVMASLGLGLLWSFLSEAYDLHSQGLRVAFTALSIVCSFLLLWGGLALSKVPIGGRTLPALWALLPWNGFLLAQLAYVGYAFIPLEIGVSAFLLRRRTDLSRPRAFLLATAVRMIVFVVMAFAASAVRRVLARCCS